MMLYLCEIYDMSDNTKRIAFFIGGLMPGGAQKVVTILAEHYADRGFDVDVCALLFPDHFYDLPPHVHYLDFTGGEGSRWKRVPFWLHTIRSYVRREKPDVIISFVARINVLALIACTGLNVRIIVSERNDPRHDNRGVLGDVMTKMLYLRAERIVFQTERALDYFPERIRRKGIIIFNPVTVTEFASKNKSKHIVNVAKMSPQKNQKMLIEAFGKVIKAHPDYQLWIYGEGELREELEDLTRELRLQDSVFMPGAKKNVHELIKDAELFVLSSDYEGLSNALLEAMMMGITVISTDCAGSNEAIRDGENGMLVPVGDKDALARAMCFCIENSQKAKEYALEAKKSAERYSPKRICAQWDELIDATAGMC